MTSIISRLFGRSKAQTPKVKVTSINIKFMGNSHGLDGRDVEGSELELEVPFQNKMGSGLLPDNLSGPKIVLNTITVGAPFKLLNVFPQLPVSIPYMSRTVFKLKIGVPNMTYEGPLSINFGNEPANNVTISIKKVTLHQGPRAVELEDSGVTSSMQKSQLFKQNIQLYKVASFGDTINGISVSKPFELVSTEPKLPIKADRKDSYIVGLYLKCPDYSYAGDLDINFE